MEELALIAGFGGGIIRGLVGFIKHQYAYKQVPFSFSYFLFTIAISGGIGVTAAFTIKELGIEFLGTSALTPAMALIIGYAGGDFLENVFKIILRKPEWYSLSKKK
tara:strand:+ start:1276 stop:1593 length:318 start_codon:yes stop_codon:yes gene_type:complete